MIYLDIALAGCAFLVGFCLAEITRRQIRWRVTESEQRIAELHTRVENLLRETERTLDRHTQPTHVRIVSPADAPRDSVVRSWLQQTIPTTLTAVGGEVSTAAVPALMKAEKV